MLAKLGVVEMTPDERADDFPAKATRDPFEALKERAAQPVQCVPGHWDNRWIIQAACDRTYLVGEVEQLRAEVERLNRIIAGMS